MFSEGDVTAGGGGRGVAGKLVPTAEICPVPNGGGGGLKKSAF